MTSFRALVTRELEPGRFASTVESREEDELPPGEVTIAVAYSSLNYKDMLSATGHKGITRRYPHTPGIDAAGRVVASSDPAHPVGSSAVVIGYDLGMNTSGGFGQRIRVPSRWVLQRPAALDERTCMQFGTAGLTAGLCVDALLADGLTPDRGEVLVTGASGGVGSIATAILAKHGFRVVAASRKDEARDFLLALGAALVIKPDEAMSSGGRPVAKERWAAVVDTVGGELLVEALKATRYGGAVAACGMSGGVELHASVYPFILRGVHLLGVDSVELPREKKQAALDRLADVHALDSLDRIATEIGLDELPAAIEAVRTSSMIGRRVVRVG